MGNTLGKRISSYRKSLGMTQEQLAERLGITAQAVSKWENDLSCPDISVLPLLADIFGVSTDILLGRTQMPAVIDSTVNSDRYTERKGTYAEEDCDDAGSKEQVSSANSKQHTKDSGKLYILGTAVWLLLVGTVYLFSKVFSWDCSLWDILWPSFLLVFGVFGLIKKISLFGLACAGVGTFFLVSNIFPLPLELDKGILWAIIIIFCGITLLLDTWRKKRSFRISINNDSHAHEYRINDNYLFCENSFGEEKQLIITDRLDGGKIENSFGEYVVDLSGVESVSGNCILEASCNFGELIILVPKHFTVVPKLSEVFASISVTGTPDEMPQGSIYLHASVSFGEVVIRYI